MLLLLICTDTNSAILYLQSKMGATKDFEMSPFEAARKLLSLEAQHLSLGQQSDLIFQDMDLVPLLIQENYLNHRPIISQSDASRLQVWPFLIVHTTRKQIS